VLGQGATAANIILTPSGTGKLLVGTTVSTALNPATLAVTGNATLDTAAAHVAIFNKNDAVNSQFYGLAFTNSNTPEGGVQKPQAYISAISNGGSWSSNWSANLVFATATGGATAAPTEKVRVTNTGNLLIGGTTDIPGSGGLKVFGTTAASSTTSGALQVAGGVGVAGASYFGSQVTAARPFMSTGAITANMTSAGGFGFSGGGTNFYSFGANASTSGSFAFQSVSSDASINFNALTLAAGTGAATFAGAVTASTSGNTALSVFSTDAATGNPFVRVGYNSNLSGQLSNDAATGKTYLDSRYNDVTSAVIIRTKASGTPVVNATFDSTGASTFAGAVTTANKFAVSAYASNSFLTGNGSGFLDNYYNGGSGFDTLSLGVNYDRRNNAISSAIVATGDLRFEQGTGGQSNFIIALGGTNTVPTDRFTIASSGNATFSGAVSTTNSTASTGAGTGALQVAGGIYAGAASYFASTLTNVGQFWNSSTGNTTTNGFNDATNIAGNIISVYASTGSANIQKVGRITVFDGGSGYYGLNLQAPTSAYPNFGGTVNYTNVLTLTSQAATFAGAVAVAGATVSTSTGIITPAATTAISSVRLPHGTAPTSPVNGDMWTTTAGLYVRINGVTVGPLS
jgi:hypothetical protein